MEENNQKNEPEQASDFEFLQEKIKERPINKKKLLQRTVITASLALLFGLIACLTFLVLEPVLNNWLYPEEEPNIITFPEEQDEMLPEDMLTEGEHGTDQTESEESTEYVIQSAGQESIQEIDNRFVGKSEESTENIQLSEYQSLYTELNNLYKQVSTSLVTVTGVKSDVDWFNNTYQSEGNISGVIIANNNKELLILTKKSPLKGADTIQVTFCDSTIAEGVIKQYDTLTDLVVIAVDLKELGTDVLDDITVATLGSSVDATLPGSPVIAVGNLLGYKDSVCYGMITSVGNVIAKADSQYKLMTTDIYGSQNPTGIIIDMKGQVVGVIDNSYNHADTKNLVSAIGITEIKGLIAMLSNGVELPYVGMYVQDIAYETRKELGLPMGAYIYDIAMDSPALKKGIQKGDILVQFDGRTIKSASDYVSAIRNSKVEQTVKIQVRRLSQNEYQLMEFEIQLNRQKTK